MINKKFLLSLTTLSLLLSGCTEKETTQDDPIVTEKKAETTVDKVANSVINQIETTAKKTEELAKEVQTSAAPVVKDIANTVKDVQKNISETTMDDVKTKISDVSTPIMKTVKEAVTFPDTIQLYKKCASCHGLNAEKKALNKSAIIKDWNAQQIEEALKGYKAGTYGGAMKGVMKAQASALTNKEIEALAKHIADFK